MTKPRKRKVGLQKKVSSVFEGVYIPQADDIVQTPPKSTSDGPRSACSKPTPKDSLVSKSSLMKKVRQSESSPDKTVKKTRKTVRSKRTASAPSASKGSTTKKSSRAKDKPDKTVKKTKKTVPSKRAASEPSVSKDSTTRKTRREKSKPEKAVKKTKQTVLSKRKAPVSSASQDSTIPKTRQVENKPDKVTLGRTTDPLPKLTVLDRLIPHRSSAKKPPKAKDLMDNAAPDRTFSVPPKLTVPDDLILQRALVREPLQTQNTSDKNTSDRTVELPPKQTVPDHPISQTSSIKAPEPTERVQGKAEPDRMKVTTAQRQSAAREPTSQNALVKKLHQAKDKPDRPAADLTGEDSSTLKFTDLPTSKNAGSDKRYDPEAPARKAEPFEQQETPVSATQSGPSLWQQINNRLFAPQPGVSPARQKIMVISIPILAIIMIFIFRQVLSKSPRKTKGDPAQETALIVEADPSHEIDWQIPEPLPATMRDPTRPPVENDTQNEEQNQTVDIPKRKLVKIGSIVYSDDKSSAIVNGRIVHIGDRVSGITILRINRDSVEFEKDGEKWIQKKRNRKR